MVWGLYILSVGAKAQAQGSVIIFNSDTTVSVEVCRPVDGAYNPYMASNHFNLSPKEESTCRFKVSDFSIVACKFSDNQKVDIILLENDTINLRYTSKSVTISGKNSLAQDFYNSGWSPRYAYLIRKSLKETTNDGIDIHKIMTSVSEAQEKDFDYLNKLFVENRISKRICEIIKKEVLYSCNSVLLFQYINSLENQKNAASVRQGIDLMVKSLPPWEREGIKYRYSAVYLSFYFKYCFEQLDERQKAKLKKKYSQMSGNEIPWFLAPDYIRLPALGTAIVLQNQYKIVEFDDVLLLDYLTAKYPQSEYVAILTPLIMSKAKKEQGHILFIDKEVPSLRDLSCEEVLNGKFLYIDVWATWCAPCRMEFSHNEQLDRVLAGYRDLMKIYISIDDIQQEEHWRSQVNIIDLQGFHLRASEQLQNDIYKQVYKTGNFVVPRSILLSPEGELLDNNLPPPSQIGELKRRLDKYLKKF